MDLWTVTWIDAERGERNVARITHDRLQRYIGWLTEHGHDMVSCERTARAEIVDLLSQMGVAR